MAVYYKNGIKYVGTMADRMMAQDNKKTTTTTNTNTNNSSGGSTSGSTSGITTSSISRDNTSTNTSGGNSQYTGSSTAVKVNDKSQQSIKDQMNANSIEWWSADETRKKQLEAENQKLAAKLGGTVSYDSATGTWSGTARDDSFEYTEEMPEYNNKYDPQIEALLNEILNRDDFSYDAANDPLYQQYVNMYRREGDRAMKETMAEAAAGAGGMNTYAITAAQQANNYYNSQLNDKIPELYQLAYEMYLKDKESKVQDLGLLQGMDATQYNRYRDTMTDWKDDRNFAYGVYQDDVEQGNWERTFDNNNYWANKEFDYNDFWANKNFNYNDEWKNKEYTDNRADVDYERNQAEEEEAQATIDWLIKNGVTTIDPKIIEKAGLDEATVKQMITYYQQQNTPKVITSGGGSGGSGGSGGNGYTGTKNDEGTKKDEGNGYTGGNGNGGSVIEEGDGSVIGLGIGPVSDDVLEKLAKAGAIEGDENGNLYWAEGWNNENYKKKLDELSGWGNLLTLPGLNF